MKQFVAQFVNLFSFFALSPRYYLTFCYATHRVLNRFWHLHHASITQNNNLVTPIRKKNLFCVLRVNSQILNHCIGNSKSTFTLALTHLWLSKCVGGPILEIPTKFKVNRKKLFCLHLCKKVLFYWLTGQPGWCWA